MKGIGYALMIPGIHPSHEMRAYDNNSDLPHTLFLYIKVVILFWLLFFNTIFILR